MWRFGKIEDYVKNNMSQKRWRHVQGVVETAKMLAERHGVDGAYAMLAALVHDVVKEQDLDEARQILVDRGEDVYLANSSKVWHAPLGAIVAREVFGIEEEDILTAIRHHPTGRAGMSELEKVLFVADYTEPNRKYECCIFVRGLWDNLDVAVAEILKQKLDKNSASPTMHPDTLAAYQYYQKYLTIDSICTCGGFNSFEDYCLENGLIYLVDVTDEHLAAYRQRKGVGAMKYQIVVDQIELLKKRAGS